MANHMCFLLVRCVYLIMQCTKPHFIIKLWCIIEILSCKVTSVSIRDIRSGSGKGFIVRIVLEEGTKTRLVLGREIQESPVFYCYTSLLAS